ncbi:MULTISPECIES: hypothetical protein [unclassified Ruegeria]|uniref:hypothetical protein n=1 Tax=unclassified Ruegeria TaxID=2625375 RepID=UPI0020C58C70|nr:MULTISPECIES: hypothetical protein [unclassified Ruegeria]
MSVNVPAAIPKANVVGSLASAENLGSSRAKKHSVPSPLTLLPEVWSSCDLGFRALLRFKKLFYLNALVCSARYDSFPQRPTALNEPAESFLVQHE